MDAVHHAGDRKCWRVCARRWPKKKSRPVISAYAEMMTLAPCFDKEVLLRLGQAVGYPVIFKGRAARRRHSFF